MFGEVPGALALVREGRVRAIGIPDQARDPLLPEAPSFAEAGIPDVIAPVRYGLVVRRGLPETVLDRRHGGFTPRPMPRAAWDALLAEEFARSERIVRAANITVDRGSRRSAGGRARRGRRGPSAPPSRAPAPRRPGPQGWRRASRAG